MAVCRVSSCCPGENWTATVITAAAAELASEPAIPDPETWGSGSEPSVLATSAPVTVTNYSVLLHYECSVRVKKQIFYT